MSYALITGASKGIGKAIAIELAKKKYDLILVARTENILSELCETLSKEYKITCKYVAADLTTDEGIEKTIEGVSKSNIDLSILVNNAGYALWGRFDDLELNAMTALMKVNMSVPVILTHRLLPFLKKSKQAYILNVASTTAYQAIAKLAVYAACKSFMILFSRGLRYELRDSNISVTCLSPGTTDTNFMDAAGMDSPHIRKKADKVKMSAEEVAKFAVKKMLKKKNEVIPGLINKISVGIIPFVPKALTEKIAADIYKK